MKITRDNYESFFLDYLEGNLEEIMIDQFLDFLEQHPDLKEELHLFENIHLPEEPAAFTGKKHLYKSPADEKEAFDLKAIALMEGNLKDDERKGFEAYLAKHPKLQKEAALFEKTRLAVDPNIKYPDKQKLYKTSGTVVLMNWLARAAAVVILLWGINSLFQGEKETMAPTQPKQVATVKTPPAIPQKIESTEAEPAAETVQPSENKARPKVQNKVQQTPADATEETMGNEQAVQREIVEVEEIIPLVAQLETEPVEGQLALSKAISKEKSNDTRTVLTMEEYLASRAKKATNDGLLSAHRLLRAGLNVASELSGDRIEYTVKKGKVASLGFDSKLLAFEIPLEKKQ